MIPSRSQRIRVRTECPFVCPLASWELCAQHLSKSPKGKRAIPRSGGGDCHPKTWTVHPPSPQWLVQTLLQFWDHLLEFCALRCGAKAVPVCFAQNALSGHERELALQEMWQPGCLVGATTSCKPGLEHVGAPALSSCHAPACRFWVPAWSWGFTPPGLFF